MEGLQLSFYFMFYGKGMEGFMVGEWMIERETSDGQSEQYDQFEIWKYDEQLRD